MCGEVLAEVSLALCLSNWTAYYFFENVDISCFLHDPYSWHYSTEYAVSRNKCTVVKGKR